MIELWLGRIALYWLLACQGVLWWDREGKYLILAEAGVSDMKLTLHKWLQCSFFIKNCLFLPQIFTFILIYVHSSILQDLRHWTLKIRLSSSAEGLIGVIKKKKSYVIKVERKGCCHKSSCDMEQWGCSSTPDFL